MKNTSLDSEVFTTCKGEQTKTYQNFTPAKVEKLLFLPPNLNRQGEGGVRIKEYGKDFNGAAQTSVSEENLKTRNLTQPLVTIITVVFNSEKYLEPTIQSVLEQTYSNVEYIVIDGDLLTEHLILFASTTR